MPAHRRGRVVALEGPSAVGKTTTGRALTASSGWILLPEAAATIRPRPSLQFRSPRELLALERRLLAAERRRMDLAERLRNDGVDVLLDTAPLGPATYSLGYAELHPDYVETAVRVVETVVADLAARRLTLPDRVVLLDAPAATLRHRADGSPRSHPARLVARHWAVGAAEGSFWSTVAERQPNCIRRLSTVSTVSAASRAVLAELRRPGPGLDVRVVAEVLREAVRAPLGTFEVTVKKGASSRRLPRR